MKGLWKLLLAIVAFIVLLGISNPASEVISAANENSGRQAENETMLYIGSPVAYVNGTEARIDGENPNVVPLTKDNRTLVPVRFIAESLGLEVQWVEKTSGLSITGANKNIKMTVGSTGMQVGNKQVKLEVPPETMNGRTFVPLRSLVEALDKEVFYDRGLIIISDNENIYNADTDKAELDEIISRMNKPFAIGSREALMKLVEEYFDAGQEPMFELDVPAMAQGVELKKQKNESAASSAVSNDKAAYTASDYSTTNVQVQGVDEADVVKTDGEYIYQVNRGRVVVAKAYPADSMEVVDTIEFSDANMNPQELYVDAKHMVVIGTTYGEINILNRTDGAETYIYPPMHRFISTKAIVYDIADKKNITKLREVELEGNYASSRKIGSSLYLVANKNIGYWIMQKGYPEKYQANESLPVDESAVEKYRDMQLIPSYSDTATGSGYLPVDFSKMYYFPDCAQPNFMTIAVLDLEKENQKAAVSAYLGAGENIYASTQNLYIAATKRSYDRMTISANDTAGIAKKRIGPVLGIQADTMVYKFSLGAGTVTYLCKGEVPGTILNQFSMDENGKYFRIATTSNAAALRAGNSTNNVYVLNDTLGISGKLEDLAPGERIYSVRFMGDRAYVVTFKKVDPLFVIDLKDAANPKVLGALKIPGYSDYLHPYDENHIIGFGKDTVAVKENAYYMGLKMAIFDVSDVTSPKEMFTEKIGDRGTESELLRNHKALLFSKEKNLLAFPVTLMEVKDEAERFRDGYPQYGQFTFQGAYIYNIDLVKGFTQKGRITHISGDEYAKAGNYWYSSDKNVERILYIGDTLYTLSQGKMKANMMGDLADIKELEIK